MLAIGIKSDDVFYFDCFGIASEELKSGFESGTSSAVLRVCYVDDIGVCADDFFGIVAGSIVDDENFFVASFNDSVDNDSNAGPFVVGPYEKDDVALIYFRCH